MSWRLKRSLSTEQRAGLGLALVTAVVSGVSIFVNSYAVKEFPDPTLFATLKNALVGLALLLLVAKGGAAQELRRLGPRNRIGLALLGIVGGSVPFVLFFEGLAHVTSGNAAFIHKTLFLWVAALALVALKERPGSGQILALGSLLLATMLMGGPGALDLGQGAAMVLGATLLWSGEVILAKRLLSTVSSALGAAARMGIGGALLVGYAGAQGSLARIPELTAMQWAWALGTAALLFAYVTTWYAALSRAPASTVTCVLTLGAPITALLATLSGRPAPAPDQVLGYAMLMAGVAGYVLVASHVAAARSEPLSAAPLRAQ